MADPASDLSTRLRAAAASLSGQGPRPAAADLLRYLGYDDGDASAVAGRARMLWAAAGFRRLFRLAMPDAPGLTFFGAEADPAVLGASVVGFPLGGCAGSGLTPSHAFESCVGEGIEFLSQFAQPGDALQAATLDAPPVPLDPGSDRFVRAVFAACTIPADRSVDWVPVRRMSDGTSCWFPADLCLRRTGADFVPPLKLSTGCAAGVSREDATLRAMLELVERDAAALWWRGGRRGRPIVPASEAATVAATLLAKVRRGQGDRRTVLLDITTDLGVPVVAAFSARPDGYGFALGLGARTSLAEATGSAILELCQSELSLHVIEAKRLEAGEAALNESDRRQVARATMLDTRTCPLLQPDDAEAAPPPTLSDDPAEAIARLLAARGIVAYTLDLTRPRFEIPVVRAIAPGLQLDPCDLIGDRLARAIAETGGGAPHSAGIVLL
ncbi:MAG: ribosomal protein methylthiotransferase accessory factor [Acetobacteraceae bacterium]|jgi:ribosomal protein S12 methylthiotransferase accessory factor|nr:ribosomal protein methylthiotransferase accessory factor [Acetobacteraceae bacterium]